MYLCSLVMTYNVKQYEVTVGGVGSVSVRGWCVCTWVGGKQLPQWSATGWWRCHCLCPHTNSSPFCLCRTNLYPVCVCERAFFCVTPAYLCMFVCVSAHVHRSVYSLAFYKFYSVPSVLIKFISEIAWNAVMIYTSILLLYDGWVY